MSTRPELASRAISATKALSPSQITGWGELEASRIHLVRIDTDPDHVSCTDDKFHLQFRAEVDLIQTIEGKSVSCRAFVPGSAAGMLQNDEVIFNSAQLRADELYLEVDEAIA